MNTDPHATCQNPTCRHAQDEHSRLSGCTSLAGNGPSFCLCTGFQAPATPDRGPTIPARNTDPDTSHKATAAIIVKAGSQRTLLLGGFAAYAEDGATDEEAMEAVEGVAPSSEYAKRASELREGGYITATEQTRPGNSGQDRMVSVITEKGTLALSMIPEAQALPRRRPVPRNRPVTLTPTEADALRRLQSRLAAGSALTPNSIHALGVDFTTDLSLVVDALWARQTAKPQ